MLEVDEHLQRLAHDGVRAAALDVGDEPDATGVVLIRGIIETLGGRLVFLLHPSFMNEALP